MDFHILDADVGLVCLIDFGVRACADPSTVSNPSAYEMSPDELGEMVQDLVAASLDRRVVSQVFVYQGVVDLGQTMVGWTTDRYAPTWILMALRAWRFIKTLHF